MASKLSLLTCGTTHIIQMQNIQFQNDLGPQDGPDHEINFWFLLRLPRRKHLKAFTSQNIHSRKLIVAFQRLSIRAGAVVCRLFITGAAAAADNPAGALSPPSSRLLLLHQGSGGPSHGAPSLHFNVYDLLPSGRRSESIKTCTDRRLITFCEHFNGFTKYITS